MISTYYCDDEERKKALKIEKRMKKDEAMVKIDNFNHGAKKLFKLKKQVEARCFSIKIFKYLRSALFLFGSLFTVSFFDVPIIKTEAQVMLLVLNLIVAFFILTFTLYLLSIFYFLFCKAIYYLIHKKDKNPYKSTGNIAKDTKKMYNAAKKISREASSLWHDWRHALYVKRSRILKIATVLGCCCVVFLKGYFNTNNNIHQVFNELGLFSEKIIINNIVTLCLLTLGFASLTYFILWLVFYFSDRMILATQVRIAARSKCEKFEKKFYEYWRDNDPVEYNRYWDEIHRHAEERAREESRRSPYTPSSTNSAPDYIIVPRIDVSDM